MDPDGRRTTPATQCLTTASAARTRRPGGRAGRRRLRRLFGFSRNRAAELAAAGEVQVDGSVPASPIGCRPVLAGGGDAQTRHPVQVSAEPVEGMEIVYEDDDIVVVDKPVGVAAHPSPGWTGTTVIGGLAAAGVRRSRPPAPPSARASCTGSTSAPAA